MMTCDAGISEIDKSFLSPSAADQRSSIADDLLGTESACASSGFKHTIREKRESKKLAAANSGGGKK